MVAPVKRGTLREQVKDHLFTAILRTELLPGDRIVEQKLARQLGVAQTTLREALQELEHQGLVTKYDHRGSFVTKVTLREIDDLYAVRLLLEPHAAALAHARLTPEDFARLESLLEQMAVAGKKRDFVELIKMDLNFHELIWERSGNRWLYRALRLVCPPVMALDFLKLYSAPTYDFTRAQAQHRELLQVLRRGGPQEVKEVFEKMIEVFRAQDIQNLEAIEPRRSGSPEVAEGPR